MPDVFGVYDDMKVWEYLDFFARCYGLAGGAPAPDDRRPARARRPWRQARRLRPGPVARHAAAPVPGPRPGPRPGGPAARRARLGPRPARPGRAARAPARAAVAGQDDPDLQPHPARARGAVHQRRDRGSWPGPGPGPGLRHRAAAAPRGRAAGPGARRRRRRSRPPGPISRPTRMSPRRTCSTTARSRSGSAATTRHRPGCSARPIAAGLPIVTFARAASDLEELFLQVTAPADGHRRGTRSRSGRHE